MSPKEKQNERETNQTILPNNYSSTQSLVSIIMHKHNNKEKHRKQQPKKCATFKHVGWQTRKTNNLFQNMEINTV